MTFPTFPAAAPTIRTPIPKAIVVPLIEELASLLLFSDMAIQVDDAQPRWIETAEERFCS
jgi:hypothetical protein